MSTPQVNIKLGADTSALRSGVNQAKQTLGSLKKTAAGVAGAFASMVSGRWIRGVFAWADDIADLQLKLNESAETLQKVDFVAKQTGAGGIEQVADAMIRLEKSLGDVENQKATDALKSLGLTADELAAMSLDQKILALSDAFQRARASGTGVNDIMALLGRSAAELIPLLATTRENLEAMLNRAPIISEEDIANAAMLNDQFDEIGDKIKTWGKQATISASGILKFLKTGIMDGFDAANEELVKSSEDAMRAAMERTELAKRMSESMRQNRETAKTPDDVTRLKNTAQIYDSLAKIGSMTQTPIAQPNSDRLLEMQLLELKHAGGYLRGIEINTSNPVNLRP